MFAAPTQLIQVVTKWHVRSQQVARRNAMVSCTALAERRRELAEVEEFLTAHAAARAARTAILEVQVRPA